jgi:hypothetical protein
VTALAGQVLTLAGEPLARVTLTMERPSGRRTARTDATGRFLLTGIEAGRQELVIDGRTASRARKPYGVFEGRRHDPRGREQRAAIHDLDAADRHGERGADRDTGKLLAV